MDFGSFGESEVAQFRSGLRPLLYNSRITGYNIYPRVVGSKQRFVISYMHNGLGDDESKLRNSHKKRLMEELRNIGIGDVTCNVATRTITRTAVYRFIPLEEWEDPDEEAEAYGENDERIPLNEIRNYPGKVVLQAKEHELTIEVDAEKELREILKTLKDFCHKYEVDDDWRIKNDHKVTGDKYSWLIPPIIISQTMAASIRGFVSAAKLAHRKNQSELSILIKKDDQLKLEIENAIGISMDKKEVLANRVFADYLSGIMPL